MSEIVVHNNDKIHTLLCGKQQQIGPVPKHRRSTSHLQSTSVRDYSAYPFPAPIEPSKPVASPEPLADRPPPTPIKSVTKIKASESDIQQIDHYLRAYEATQHRKAQILHYDLEEHYLQPLARRLTKKMTGSEYEDFVRRKQRALSAFEAKSKANDTFLDPLPEIPRIEMRTGDLADPVSKYKRNAEREELLEETIARSTGEYQDPAPIPVRDTMNVREWVLLAETRFHTDASGTAAKGKRSFPGMNRSSIDSQINEFQPAPGRIIPERRTPSAAVDHIKFGED